MLHASLSAGPDFSDSSVDNKVIFFDFALHNEIVRVDANDILYRLQKEERERGGVFRRGQPNACDGSIRGHGHIYRLTSDAVNEIVRLILKLKESGIDYEPPSA
ncbi:MAG: hypothetical protein ACJ8DW_07295 [Microvirga sp.]|jgi:hypothetical protein